MLIEIKGPISPLASLINNPFSKEIKGPVYVDKKAGNMRLKNIVRFLAFLILVLSAYSIVFMVDKETLHSLSLENGPFEIAGALFLWGPLSFFIWRHSR